MAAEAHRSAKREHSRPVRSARLVTASQNVSEKVIRRGGPVRGCPKTGPFATGRERCTARGLRVAVCSPVLAKLVCYV